MAANLRIRIISLRAAESSARSETTTSRSVIQTHAEGEAEEAEIAVDDGAAGDGHAEDVGVDGARGVAGAPPLLADQGDLAEGVRRGDAAAVFQTELQLANRDDGVAAV